MAQGLVHGDDQNIIKSFSRLGPTFVKQNMYACLMRVNHLVN